MKRLFISPLILILITVTWAAVAAAAEIPEVEEIVDRANKAAYYAGSDGKAKVSMTITDAQGRVRKREPRRDSSSGSKGSAGPEALPKATIVPRRARQRREPSKVALPTESYTTGTPAPPVISRTLSTKRPRAALSGKSSLGKICTRIIPFSEIIRSVRSSGRLASETGPTATARSRLRSCSGRVATRLDSSPVSLGPSSLDFASSRKAASGCAELSGPTQSYWIHTRVYACPTARVPF